MCLCVVVQRLIEEENMLAPSLQQFSLRTEMLPSYIPIRVAEKILFVGESVQMFENHNHSPSRAGSLLCHDLSEGYKSAIYCLYITKTTQHDAFILGSILKHQEDMFAAELHKLKQQPLFSLVDFENLIDRIRSTVAEVSSYTAAAIFSFQLNNIKAKLPLSVWQNEILCLIDLQHLWTLMVEESELLEQLKVCIYHTYSGSQMQKEQC